jgi:activating signal cointegrator 1
MKALTLYQPWAQLVIDGHKKLETRPMRINHRGDLLIHAAKKFNYSDLELCYQDEYFNRCIPEPTKLITGALLGIVTVDGCYRIDETTKQTLTKQELTFGEYRTGRYAWLLRNVRKFEKPIYGVSGSQGLWDYEFDYKKHFNPAQV